MGEINMNRIKIASIVLPIMAVVFLVVGVVKHVNSGNLKAQCTETAAGVIVDVDSKDKCYLNTIKEIVNDCQSGFDKNVIQEIETKSGVHLITHPFNIKQYKDLFDQYYPFVTDVPEIKKNHITLLYENL
jgi:uncharacterized protein (UPF0333 family)